MRTIFNEAGKQGLSNLVRGELTNVGIRPTDVLVVAVSGGPDSMVLLDLLTQIYCGHEQKLLVAHINHGLRKTADKEEKLVEDYVKKHKLQFISRRVSLEGKKTGIEERARELRYAALQEIAFAHKASWIITAHTADDQVETVIANWMRGSGVRGLGGMHLVAGNIVRPMLNIHKEKLLDYAKKHKLRYAVDESNASFEFTRNRIRHQLLPILRKFNSQIDNQLLNNSRIWRQVDEALTELARIYLHRIGKTTKGRVVLSISKLRELTPLIQVEVLKLAIRAVGGNLVDLEQTHFVEVGKLMASSRHQVKKRRLGGELFISKAYDKITVSQS